MSVDVDKSLFELIKEPNHEQIIFCNDNSIGLKAIIAIHNTNLGPAIGGTRMWNYSTDEEALKDVLNLSKAMSYKSSLAGLNAGGGKAVLIGQPSIKDRNYLKRFAQFIKDLNGKYWTAQDVNMTTKDIVYIKEICPFVVGLPKENGGLGDSSTPTAYGVYMGMKSATKHLTGSESLEGKKVLVQGVGNVGLKVVDYLVDEGTEIYVSDINSNNLDIAKSRNVNVLDSDNIYNISYDIISPCALGGTINKESLEKINCKIIAGAANNQLGDDNYVPNKLSEKEILYVPDFLVNAGGIISVYHEQIKDLDSEKVMKMTEDIYYKVIEVLKYSNKNKISTNAAAISLAKDRIAQNYKK